MDQLVALNPVAASHAKLSLNGGIVEETVGVAQVVAQRGHITLLADIVNVERRGQGVAENGSHGELADFKSLATLNESVRCLVLENSGAFPIIIPSLVKKMMWLAFLV